MPGDVRERPALRRGGVRALRDDRLRVLLRGVARDRQAQARRAVHQLTRVIAIPDLGVETRVTRPHVRDCALLGEAAHHVDATITDAQVDQVQGRARVGGHRVCGPIRRRRQAHAAG